MTATLRQEQSIPVRTHEPRRSAVGAPEVVDPRSMRGPLVIAMVCLVAGLGLTLWALTDSLKGTQGVDLPRIEVPLVTSLDLGAARAELESVGFVVDVQFQPNEDATKPKGAIISQKPLAGSKAEQGELVVILASDGPLGQAVPDVGGQQAVDAVATLQANGLTVETVPTVSETVRPNEVIATDPPSGRRVPTAGAVKLLVSSGPAPRLVPAVLNKPLEQALADIGRSGLAVGKINRVFRADVLPGLVFETDPPAGTPLPRDTPVGLSIAGPEPTTTVPYLAGLHQASAETVLRNAGLAVRVITTPVTPGDASEGRVLSQGTPPQAEVKENSVVEITVAVPVAPVAAPTVPPAVPPGG